MKQTLVLLVALIFCAGSYAQQLEFPSGKVYLKDGTVTEGMVTINTNESRLGGVEIKGKKYLKEVSVKAKKEKKVKIGIDQIDRVEVQAFVKAFSKQTETIIYRPMLMGKENVLARELVANKLYAVLKPVAFSAGGGGATPGDNFDYDKHWVYYINNAGTYERTTLAQLKHDNNCNMDGKGNREEKIVRCIQ
jgi:uncharacterized protein with NAD-binding domain and iron-sulfur cluster